MEIVLLPKAKEQLQYLHKSGNKLLLKKISELINAIQESPNNGLGKPELLKYELSGLSSRRINREHRLIYEVENDIIYIYSCFGHYI